MTALEVHQRLLTEGCNPLHFAVLDSGKADDALCLDCVEGKWIVFYTERGNHFPAMFESVSEIAACDFFFNKVMAEEHRHIVGFFREEDDAKALEAKLIDAGINPILNDIEAYREANDPRFRVYVVGKAIFEYRQLYGEPIVVAD